MSVSHSAQYEPTRVDVWTVLKELPHRVQELLTRHESSRELGFDVLEQELHALFTHAECAATREALERQDVDLPYMFIDGEKHHRVYRGEKTYLCAVGPVTAMRTLYRARPGERAVAALERQVGIVEGYWTPHAARQGAMLTAHLVPREAEEVLQVLGNMTPSKSSLDRLPKALSARWEAQRPPFEARVREAALEVPDTACTVAVSLDGVMAPMKTGGGGYREASCASVSLYDGEGERLSTVRMARMPESKKVTLKTMVAAEVEAVLGQRPDLQLVKIADGAKDNWTFLSRVLPEGVELIDFFHAAEHLKGAFDAAYGADAPKATAQFEKYRHRLRHETDGVEKVIRALRHLCSKHPECERLAQVLGYFRNNRHRMGYAEAKEQGLPIGSGVVEATCKTLVTERLKRSGMRCVSGCVKPRINGEQRVAEATTCRVERQGVASRQAALRLLRCAPALRVTRRNPLTQLAFMAGSGLPAVNDPLCENTAIQKVNPHILCSPLFGAFGSPSTCGGVSAAGRPF